MMVASFLAAATHAFFTPMRFASFTPKLLEPTRSSHAKMRVGGLVESVGHHLVTALADISWPVNLPTLIDTRCQPQAGIWSSIVRSEGLAVLEEDAGDLVAGSIIDSMPFTEALA